MTTNMKTCVVLLVAFLLALAPAAPAQQDKVSFPCEVEVNANSLNLRAGIGQAYVIVHTAKKGDTLVALEEQLGWYRIKPPAGVFVYLAKEFVDLQGPGAGVVKGDRVNARPTADTKHPPVCQFAKGTQLRVAGEVNGWIKIAAPANSSCWVKKDFVKFLRPFQGAVDASDGSSLVTAPEPGAGAGPAGPGTGPGTPPGGGKGNPPGAGPGTGTGPGTPSGVPGAGTGQAGPPAAGTEGPDAPELAQKMFEADKLIILEQEKPVKEQDYHAIITNLREIAFDPRPSPAKKQAMSELDRLEPLQKILDQMHQIEIDRNAGITLPATPPTPKHAQYDGQGWLDGMGKVINRPGTHKLIKGGKILFYLRSFKFDLDDSKYYGKLVGVRGKVTEVPNWPQKVIEVEQIDVLGE